MAQSNVVPLRKPDPEAKPPTYSRTIRELRTLIASSVGTQWQMGDLILALIPYQRPGEKRPDKKPRQVIEQLSTDLEGELKPSTMMNLRATSYAWPQRERKRASWTAHYHLKHNKEMLINGMTTPEALRKVSRKPRNRFKYALRLLRSSITFMEAAERYMPQFAADDKHMEVMGPVIADAVVALDSLLAAAGMGEEE